jgi:hypothetical protein
MPIDIRRVNVFQNKWQSYTSGLFYPDEPVVSTDAVLYDQATIDAWNTTDVIPNTTTSAYTAVSNRLNSAMGGNTRSITDRGTGALQGIIRDQGASGWAYDARYAKMQAVLWAADGSATRRNKVIEVLDSVKDCRGIQYTGRSTYEDGQQKLELSWAVPNWCEAAWIIGYSDANFDAFLDSVYQYLLWRVGGNWHGTMANARWSIANFRNSDTKRTDAMAFFEFYIKRAIYHATYDGTSIVPTVNLFWDDPNILTAAGHSTNTASHWWSSVTSSSPWTARDPRSGYTFASGIDAEFRRDWNHTAMAIAGWANCARNIQLYGGTVPAHAHARIRECANIFGQRVLHIVDNNGTGFNYVAGTESPSYPTYDNGGSGTVDRSFAHAMVWPYVVKTYLAGETPASVNSLIARSRVYAAAEHEGWNSVAAERLAEGSLL